MAKIVRKLICGMLSMTMAFSMFSGLIDLEFIPSFFEKSQTVLATIYETTGVGGFVTRLYDKALGRTPDESGYNDWVNQLNSGSRDGATCAYGFFFSTEYINKQTSDDTYVETLYNVFFNRSSDAPGKADWLNRMSSLGWSRQDVFYGFVNSNEWAEVCFSYGIISGGSGVARTAIVTFVTSLYSDCLGRTPDETGLNDWVNQLVSHQKTGKQVAYGFFFSDEFKNKANNINDSSYVDTFYHVFLNRNADSTGKTDWTNRISRTTFDTTLMFSGFADSQEFTNKCRVYGITAGDHISVPNVVRQYRAPVPTVQTVSSYTYTITPMVDDLNNYFYVKTDNPDPTSFCFVDTDSVYATSSSTEMISRTTKSFSDVCYENADTSVLRVKGGYIFVGINTDGGDLKLELKVGSTYTDTGVVVSCNRVYDSVDYLINRYATRGASFFDNMDAVRDGLDDIAFYQGAWVRGELARDNDSYWGLSSSPHVDQLFYVQDPYYYKSSSSLLVSALYNYSLDSLGFPSMLAKVAKRLDSSSTCVWNSASHALVDVTYGDITKPYGGQGIGGGHEITQSQVNHFFTFDGSLTDLSTVHSLAGLGSIISEYGSMTKPVAGYDTNELTFQMVMDTLSAAGGRGSWVSLCVTTSVYGGSNIGYTYFGRTTNAEPSSWLLGFAPDSSGDMEYSYVNTVMRHFSDCWVEGRYINSHEVWEQGVTFASHPTSSIAVYDTTSGPKPGYVIYYYVTATDQWEAIVNNTRLVLTRSQVAALGVDSNTNTAPGTYYSYDMTQAPGTRHG